MEKCKGGKEEEKKRYNTIPPVFSPVTQPRKITRKYLSLPPYENSKLKLAFGKEQRASNKEDERGGKRGNLESFFKGEIPRRRRKFERVSIKPRTVALKKWGEERKKKKKERKDLALLDKGKIKIRGQEEKPI